MACEIVNVGRRRDGGNRYWCLAHKANATAKYGVAAPYCVAAHDAEIPPDQCLNLDWRDYPGGVALWGSVPAVYDTTSRSIDRGIHVHARKVAGPKKDIDWTYRKLRVPFDVDLLSDGWLQVDEVDAINFMVSGVFGFETIPVVCTRCKFEHLDRDWFAVHNHRRHLCHGCGQQFSDTVVGVGNPLSRLKQLEKHARRSEASTEVLNISQRDYPGGLQIWGSNPAIYWTADLPEQTGIHVHCFESHEAEMPAKDDTYASVVIDGVSLNALQVRHYMAQTALPHIEGRVVSLACPNCEMPHFDVGELAYTPHIDHECHGCGIAFRAPGQIKKTISNPFFEIRDRLGKQAPNPLRNDPLGLRPETI